MCIDCVGSYEGKLAELKKARLTEDKSDEISNLRGEVQVLSTHLATVNEQLSVVTAQLNAANAAAEAARAAPALRELYGPSAQTLAVR